MRLSLLTGQPPSAVLGWPASDVQLTSAYLAQEPAPAERLEYAIAYMSCMYANAHRGNRPEIPLERFLMFRHAWHASGRYTETDIEILESIDRIGT